nr:hypothetical protein [Tanacetum cinerariifolium]
MAYLTFADTHNMVAYLSKSDASADFDQIFWATVAIKKVNDMVKLRALIDGKRVVITEDVIRQAFRLDDADGVDVKRTAWNEFSCLMTSAVICLEQVEILTFLKDLSSHKNQYTSSALTQKVFANMRRVGKGFLGVETSLFATMIVQPQPPGVEKEYEVEVPNAPTPPSPTTAPSPPPQEPIPIPPQAQPALPSSPPQEQPPITSESSMTLLNTLMESCTTLSHKVDQLEQDKIAQALEIFKLKMRVKKLEKQRRSKSSGLKRLRKVGTSQRVKSSTETVVGAQEDASKQGRELRKDDDNAAIKDASATEPTMFDDEEVTMTMAQTLIKMKAKKARLLDEQMAKRLHDEEVEQVVAREKKEKDDLEKDKVLQLQKNMIVYLKNMTGYKMENFRGVTYDKVRPIFKREYNKVQTLFKPDKDEEPTKKRVAEETLLQESFKKLK